METMRDLVEEAYDISTVLGEGMHMSGTQLTRGLSRIQLILAGEFASGLPASKVVSDVTFTGSRTYTVGTESRLIDLTETDPDILLSVMPDSIDTITQLKGGIRYQAHSISASEYFARSSDTDTSEYPSQFYYNRQGYSTGFPTISFIGNPSGTAEMVFTASANSLDASTSLTLLPPAIIPYLVYELAYLLAMKSGIVLIHAKSMSNGAHMDYIASCLPKITYAADASIAFASSDSFGSANYADGKRQLMSGDV